MAQVSRIGRGTNLRSTTSRKVTFAVGLVCALLAALLTTMSPSASAATSATPITDFINYPNVPTAQIPASCPATGPGVLQNVKFDVLHNGTTTSANSLTGFSLVIGDKVTMTWGSFTPGCESLGISLAVKATQHPTFVAQDDQSLVSFAFCSAPDCGTAAGGFGHLTITIPPKEAACNFQLDAVIGPPLAKVGPHGSYYGDNTRSANGKAAGPNMLISANNGGVGKCTIPPTAAASISCLTNGAPGADVAVTNPDDDDVAHVNILKGTTVVAANVAVAPLGAVHQPVPFGNGETATLSVVDLATGTTIFTKPFTADCFVEETTTTTSTTVPPTTAPSTTAPPTTEAAATSITATTEAPTTTPATVQGTEVVRGTTLPRTGTGTAGLSATAGLLLVLGGLLMALANRPLPTMAAARTRSRGR